MNTIYNTETLYNRFWKLVEKDDLRSKSNGQLIQFYHWLYDHDFLKNLTQIDYDCFIDDDDELYLPILRNHKMAIGIDVWDDFVKIGIDPSFCFDKVSKCSIIARFPMSNREEKKFYAALEKLLDKKSAYSKEWFKEASTSWCGSFTTFGKV